MITTKTVYRSPVWEELVPGFSFEKQTAAGWLPVLLTEGLTEVSAELYSLLLKNNQLRVAYQVQEEIPDPEPEVHHPGFWERLAPYTRQLQSKLVLFGPALTSVAYIGVMALCYHQLNYLDEIYAPTVDGQVMGKGTKLFELLLTVLAMHTSALTVTNLVDWSSSNFKTYLYQNPRLHPGTFDLTNDLNNPADPAAKARLQWSQKRFYTFYFVSLGIMAMVYGLNTYLISR